MAPSASTETDQDHLKFLISCFMTTDTPNWKEVANTNGIAGTPSNSAAKLTQRKFKKLVEQTGIYALDNGKVILKGDPSTSTPATPITANSKTKKTATPATPATPTAAKKRGRPASSANISGSAKKKAKKNEVVTIEEDALDEGLERILDEEGDEDDDKGSKVNKKGKQASVEDADGE